MYSAQVIPQYTGPISFGMGLNGNRAFVPPPNVPLGTGPLINLRVRAADPLRRVPNISVFVPNSTTLGTASLFLRKDNYKPELLAVIPDEIFWQIHRRSLHSRSSQTRMGHTTNFLYFVFFGSKFLSKRLIKVEVDFISFTITFRNSKSKVFCSFRISISFTRQHRQFDS